MEIRIKSGFTLIEVILVVGIVIVIASITLANFPEFNERIGIEQEAGKFVLAARKAQSYALGVREFQIGSKIFPPYGVSATINDRIHFTVFGDTNLSNRFENFLGESVEVFTVSPRVEIHEICGNYQSIPPGPCNLTTADIVYIRPAPSIVLTGVVGGIPLSYNDIKVVFTTLDGSIRKDVVIWSTGQISIE